MYPKVIIITTFNLYNLCIFSSSLSQVKCAQYFPRGEENGFEDTLVCENSNLQVNLLKEEDFSYYVVRTLVVEDTKVNNYSIQRFSSSWQ